MTGRPVPASVHVDVTDARAGELKAIVVHEAGARMDPVEARRLADELVTAAGFVDQLAPKPTPPKEHAHA